MNAIVSGLNRVAGFFYELYLELLSWPFPLWKGAELFYQLHRLFNGLAWDFADLRDWLDFASDRLRDVLSWSNIRSLIRSWLPDLESSLSWWRDRSSWLGQRIDAWWSSTGSTVRGWILEGDRGLRALLEDVRAWLAQLQSAADAFFEMLPGLSELSAWFRSWPGRVLGVLTSWWVGAVRDVQALIDSAFLSREPFWAGWQDIRGGVVGFVSDPWEWLLERFTDWFLGPEE